MKKQILKNKKVIVFGCQQIAVDSMEIMLKKGIEIQAIITYELPLDKKYGYASVKELALKKKIPLYEPEKINKEFIQIIKNYNPDLILSIYYRKIFPPDLLKIPRLGCVNIHPGLLPYYRGPIPTFWALINGEKEFGVTLHYMDKGIDTGDIIAQTKIRIYDKDTGFTLNNKAMKAGTALFTRYLEKIINRSAKTKKQKKNEWSYFGKFSESLAIINWRKENRDIFNQVRASTKPFSGCLTSVLDKKIIIWKVKVLNKKFKVIAPGKILKVNKDRSVAVST